MKENRVRDYAIICTLNWYMEEIQALKKAMQHGEYDVGNAVVAVLSLDDGKRARQAIKLLEDIDYETSG